LQNVLLTFEHFDLEPAMSDSTCFDSVTVCDGSSPSNASRLLTYCGSGGPPQFLATSNVAMVLFHSDSTNQFTGFLASYSSKKLPPTGQGQTPPSSAGLLLGGPPVRPRRRRISSTNCVEFPQRRSRRLTSHAAGEFSLRRRRRILSPVFRRNR